MNPRLGGRFQVVREIGTGTLGSVYQAIDLHHGNMPVAAKVLAGGEVDLSRLLRFQQEGAVLSTLNHPNIVTVVGTFLEEHTSCIIMEFLSGQSLAEALRAGPFPLPAAKIVAGQVVSALVYAHGRGVLHRDLKPHNVVLVSNLHVKVTDFGVAPMALSDCDVGTLSDTHRETFLYMAPEMIEGDHVDARADIYSFGAMLYQLVTGVPPFKGRDVLSLAVKHVHERPRPPSRINPDVPGDWDAVILRALAKKQVDRFETAAALELALSTLSVEPPPRIFCPSCGERNEGAALFCGTCGHSLAVEYRGRR